MQKTEDGVLDAVFSLMARAPELPMRVFSAHDV